MKRSSHGCNALHPKPCRAGALPARLGNARNQAGGCQFPKDQPRNLEAPDKGASAAAHLTAIDHPRRAGVARQLTEAGVILLRLQLSTEGGVFLRRRALAFIAI